MSINAERVSGVLLFSKKRKKKKGALIVFEVK